MNTCSSFVGALVSTLAVTTVLWLTSNTDKKTSEPTAYIDIKSKDLRDILRTVLRDIRAASLEGNKPAVCSSLRNPVNFIPVTDEAIGRAKPAVPLSS